MRRRLLSSLHVREVVFHVRPNYASARCSLSSSSSSILSKGYQSIGSFHSENLAELMAACDSNFIPPTLPFRETAATTADWANVHDDNQERSPSVESDQFMLDLDHWTFLNHGAFGAALAVGYRRAHQWRLHLEAQPLRYFDRDLLPHLAYSTRLLAAFINAPCREHVTILQNATAGLNSVMAAYMREFAGPSKKSQHIVLWDTTYGSVKKMAQHYCGAANVTEIPLQRDHLDDLTGDHPELALQQILQDAIAKGDLYDKNPLLILDHTTSNTALTFPVERLAAQMKEAVPGAIVLVDGAHGLLAQDVNISDMMPSVDFYISNGHKWLAAPRGVAVMAVQNNERYHWSEILRPTVISHGIDEPDLLSRFVWDGTRDYAAALALPVVLEHWKREDPTIVRQKLKDQLRRGIQCLAEHWHGPDHATHAESWPGVVTLTHFNSTNMLSPMALVRLPFRFGDKNTSTSAKQVQDYLFQNQIEVPVKCINGKLYVRVSCHVYNTTNDFEKLGLAIQQYC